MRVYSGRELNNLNRNLCDHWNVIVVPEHHAWLRVIEGLIEQARLANELGAALTGVEWISTADWPDYRCASCEEQSERGHAPNCPIGNALAKWRGE